MNILEFEDYVQAKFDTICTLIRRDDIAEAADKVMDIIRETRTYEMNYCIEQLREQGVTIKGNKNEVL